MSTAPQLPETTVEVLEKDEELKYTVFTLLTSGWSPARISRHIYRTRGTALPMRDIRIFADEMPPALFLPPSYLRKKYLELDLQIDHLNTLAGAIRLTEDRLAVAALVEGLNGEGGNKKLTELVTGLTSKLFDYTERYTKLLQGLGVLPRAAEPIELRTGEIEDIPTLREILDKKEESGAESS